jgi:hypothetical protein
LLTIEYEAPIKSVCDCCGGTATRLTRFIYKDDDAFSVCYATFADKKHGAYGVLATISLGGWYEDHVPDDRVAFTVQIRSAPTQYEVGVLNAEMSLWQNSKILGRLLDRAEALTHPWLKDVFHITDHLVAEDPEIKAYFESEEVE